ncbi:hypothetical protein [Salinarchaeum chitinilyticum]
MGQNDAQEWGDEGAGSPSSSSDTENDAQNAKQQDLQEVEVVEDDTVRTSGVDALATFSEDEGPLSARILPVVKRGSTSWRVVIYSEGVQGSLYESEKKITDEVADALGISPRLQQRINNGLEYAHQELDLPRELADAQRQKRSLHELEVMMEDDENA